MTFLWRSLTGRPRCPTDPPFLRFGNDSITFDSLFSGVAAVGATGSGKTTFLELLLRRIAEHPSRPGVLWCCVKADEADRAEKIARKSDRRRDFVRLTADGPWRIDLFDYLLNVLGQSSEGVTRFLDRLAGLAVRNMGSGDDKIWQVQVTQLVGRCFDLFRCAAELPTPAALFEVLVSVPKDPSAAAGEAFLADTACGQLIVRGQRRFKGGELSPADRVAFARAVEYVMAYLPGLGDRFLGSVLGSAVTGLGQLLQPPFDRLFTGPSTFAPDILTDEGAIVALDLPAVHGPAAAVAQAAFVQLVQMFLLHAPRGDRRPVAIVRDEAQYLVVPDWDGNVQTVARSHGIISVTAVQGYPPMVAAFGGTAAARVQAETLLGSHATHLVFNPAADADTRDHYVKLFGTTRQLLFSGGQQPNPQPGFLDRLYGIGLTPTVGWGEQLLPTVPPEALTALKRGGRDHDFVVEAYLFQAGRTFSHGHPFIRVAVDQDLTP